METPEKNPINSIPIKAIPKESPTTNLKINQKNPF